MGYLIAFVTAFIVLGIIGALTGDIRKTEENKEKAILREKERAKSILENLDTFKTLKPLINNLFKSKQSITYHELIDEFEKFKPENAHSLPLFNFLLFNNLCDCGLIKKKWPEKGVENNVFYKGSGNENLFLAFPNLLEFIDKTSIRKKVHGLNTHAEIDFYANGKKHTFKFGISFKDSIVSDLKNSYDLDDNIPYLYSISSYEPTVFSSKLKYSYHSIQALNHDLSISDYHKIFDKRLSEAKQVLSDEENRKRFERDDAELNGWI